VKSVALTVLLLLSASVSGQTLERTIHLGDTWRLPSDPVAFAYDSRDRTVFIGGESSDSVLVLDEHTIEPVGWIDAGAPVPVLSYCPALNKLYCLQTGSISVYDAFTHVRLKVIPASVEPKEACLDSEDNKLYVVSGDSATVTVVDCNTDSVSAVLTGLDRGGWSRQSICYVPGWHRAYCCDYDDSSVVVIDCRADTILSRVHTPARPLVLCYNSANNRVYVLYDGAYGPTGIDVATNTVVSNAACLGCDGPHALCCNPSGNKLYGLCEEGLGVYDCSSDSIVAVVLPAYGDAGLTYSPTANKVYAVSQFG